MSLFNTISIAANGPGARPAAAGTIQNGVANFSGLSNCTTSAIEPAAVIAGFNYVNNVHRSFTRTDGSYTLVS